MSTPNGEVPLDTELTAARLAVNDWHACASNDELERWRAAQTRLIDAAQALGRREGLDAATVEHTRAILHYTAKGYMAGENADSKAWRHRAEHAEQALAALQAARAHRFDEGEP